MVWIFNSKQMYAAPQTTKFDDEASDFLRTLIEMNESVSEGIDVSPRIKYYDHLSVRKDEEPLTI